MLTKHPHTHSGFKLKWNSSLKGQDRHCEVWKAYDMGSVWARMQLLWWCCHALCIASATIVQDTSLKVNT